MKISESFTSSQSQTNRPPAPKFGDRVLFPREHRFELVFTFIEHGQDISEDSRFRFP